ncbi:MAG: photosystem I reaction center subunit XII, partial [Moorea sp. SIO3G5]|nr:photosystem I reaction center subunit XII [Moorena sp. SIO3G5]
GSPTSDSDTQAKLISSLAANMSTKITPPAIGNGAASSNIDKRFRIVYSTSTAAARLNKCSKTERVVNYSQMSQQFQNIHKCGGKIISITEVL